MSDIICPQCAEPFDIDHLHDIARLQGSNYEAVWRAFRRHGCEALGESHNVISADPEAQYRAEARAMLAELLGDDIDGYSADVEDFGLDF